MSGCMCVSAAGPLEWATDHLNVRHSLSWTVAIATTSGDSLRGGELDRENGQLNLWPRVIRGSSSSQHDMVISLSSGAKPEEF